ncbi:hypothetical protein ACHAW5_009994 [Stephanodiscus triporus]|uniref:Uncharacterized protein n=1 Tax=Stephanodiscus triporus TaxID=2934178 RepID=A0ABD3NUV6_9STRA
MFSMDWLCGQIAFIYAFNKIKPAVIVDGIIAAVVDAVVPGRGAGESTWFWRHLRSIERDTDRISRELDMRAELRRWDDEFPYFHHELIVRYVAGFMASAAAMFAWGQIRSLFVTNKRR